MAFPDIHDFPETHPGPYEKNMGEVIGALLRIFSGRMPDSESHERVLELANTPSRWSAGHRVFDEVRDRLLLAMRDGGRVQSAQYAFEECCLQAMYNASDPPDPFDPSSPFYVPGSALGLAKVIGVPVSKIVGVLT